MSRNVTMQYGRNGGVVQNRTGWKFIKGGTIIDNTTEILSFAAGGIYILVCVQWTASDGTRQGRQISLICAPEEEKFGTTACTREAMATGGTARVSYTLNSDSTISIKQTNASYNWRYVLYRIDGEGGYVVQQSDIPAYTGAYSVDPNFEVQTLATANKRMTSDVDVNAIEVASVSNPSGGNTVYIGGEISET